MTIDVFCDLALLLRRCDLRVLVTDIVYRTTHLLKLYQEQANVTVSSACLRKRWRSFEFG